MYAVTEPAMPIERNLADIYRKHHRRVFNLCAYLLNSRIAAEDAAQEAFLRAIAESKPTIRHFLSRNGF
jgi:DNA-directed RNA polymerase specialized sigma24 family protein